jgi:hypothetical protein
MTLLAAIALAGCVDNGDDGYYDAGIGGGGGFGGGVDVGDDLCAQGCIQLENCDRCLDDGGNCMSTFDCAEQCRDTRDVGTALCLVEVAACNADALDACLDGSGLDLCQQACGVLAGCDTCLTDEAGACIDDDACLDFCRSGGLEGAECLVGLDACDAAAIEACLEDDDNAGDDAGDDACADACRVLDGCDQCLTDADGACVDVAACAAECRTGWADGGACLNALQMCEDEAILACLDGTANADACMEGCLVLDGCGFCLNDDAGECIDVAACAEVCRADDATENACLRELPNCDEAPILACLATDPEPPVGADECARACAGLDGCGLCWPDDAGECMTLGGCATACRAGDPAPEIAACLGRADACGPAMDACFDAPPSVCETTCNALAVCNQLGGENPASSLALCISECDAAPDAALQRCLRDAGECAELEACTPVEPEPCVAACDRWVTCGNPEDPDEATTACLAACPAWADGAVACVTEAAECVDVAQCALEEVVTCDAVCTMRLSCTMLPDDVLPEAWLADCALACEGETPEVQACVLAAADCAAVTACAAE